MIIIQTLSYRYLDETCPHTACRITSSQRGSYQNDSKSFDAFCEVIVVFFLGWRVCADDICTISSASHDQRIRTEIFNSTLNRSEAFDFITNFYTTKASVSTEEFSPGQI
jgi:hypothetical protein